MEIAEISPATRERLDKLFPGNSREEAVALLLHRCGRNLPLTSKSNDLEIERIRCAALKLSNGNLTELKRHVEVANEDWRDVLVASGFGHDIYAHLKWQP